MSSNSRARCEKHPGPCLIGLGMTALLLVASLAPVLPAARAEAPKPPTESRIFSVFPLGDRPGATYDAVIRGVTLRDAQAIWFENDAIHARVDRAGRDPESDPEASTPTDLVNIHVTLDAAAQPGEYRFRMVTKQGVSNAISMRVTSERTITEPALPNAEPDQSPRLKSFPLVVNGRIAKKGEVDDYWFDARPGEELMFEAFSGFSAFDPSLTILERSGSWFDPQRLNPIAFNDEPLYFPDFSTNAKLAYRFERGGHYLVRVAAFEGRGSPNDVYQLRISREQSTPPSLRVLPTPGWQEHTFTRHFSADWLTRLRARGDPAQSQEALETFRAAGESAASPIMKVPGIVEGVISKPGEVQKIGFHVKGAQDLVVEVETPDSTVPLFNPVVRVLDATGREVVTNVYTQLNNCGGYMMKTIQPKTAVSLHEGDYTLRIHDIASDKAGGAFAYRVLLRPLIPHLGKIEVEQERVNLAPGAAKPLSVGIEREENYSGLVALSVEGLPPGVQAVAGSEPEEDKPPLMNGGKVERYFPKKQKSVLLLTAAPGAPLASMPQMVRVVVRPIVEGQVGQPIATESIPVMVVAGSSGAGAAPRAAAGKP